MSQGRIHVAHLDRNLLQFTFISLFILCGLQDCTAYKLGHWSHRLRVTKTEIADWQQVHKSWNTKTDLKITRQGGVINTGYTVPTTWKSTMILPLQANYNHSHHLVTCQSRRYTSQIQQDFQEIPHLEHNSYSGADIKSITNLALSSLLYMPWHAGGRFLYKWNNCSMTICVLLLPGLLERTQAYHNCCAKGFNCTNSSLNLDYCKII